MSDVRVDENHLCMMDLAEQRRVRDASMFRYSARFANGPPLAMTEAFGGEVCAQLVHGSGRYVRVIVDDGVAKGKLVAHLYDLGAGGFKLAGLERPSP